MFEEIIKEQREFKQALSALTEELAELRRDIRAGRVFEIPGDIAETAKAIETVADEAEDLARAAFGVNP